MKKIKKVLKENSIFYIILFLSIFLRIYRIGDLTTFGIDQGIDFLVVREMVVNHKWTLIGIKSSVGDFFQGPVALYLLYPLFAILDLNPIAGAYTAFIVSIVTLVLLYIMAKKYFSKESALFSSLLFAVSPELIMYGNSPLYQHFLPFFIILGFYLFLKKKKSIFDYFLIGVTAGLGMEFHFLNITLVLSFIVYFLLFEYKTIKNIYFYIAGVLGGLLPTVLFELRHDFLNTNLFFDYLNKDASVKFTLNKYLQWAVTGSRFVGGNSKFIAASILIGFFLLLLKGKKEKRETESLRNLGVILFVVINIMLFPLFNFYTQYAQGFWLIVIILLPVYLIKHYSKKISYGLLIFVVFINLLFSISRLSFNHGYNMPDGLTLNKIERIADVIVEDSQNHPNYNIAAVLDGGTRAYQYRYSVLAKGGTPDTVVNYPNNNFLYLISRENIDESTWEVNSMKPYEVGERWYFDDNVYLYRLDKILK